MDAKGVLTVATPFASRSGRATPLSAAMIYYNTIAFGFLILSIIAGVGLTRATGETWLGWVCAGIVFSLIDLVYRLQNLRQPARRREPLWLVHPCSGAHISFIPGWILGMAIAGVGVAD